MSTLEQSLAFFRPHHDELRKRLVKVFISIVLCTIVAYFFSEQIALFFIKPLFDASPMVYRLVYTNLPEAFIAYIKLALLVGIIASFPVMLYQGWSFVSPGLLDHEKKLTVTLSSGPASCSSPVRGFCPFQRSSENAHLLHELCPPRTGTPAQTRPLPDLCGQNRDGLRAFLPDSLPDGHVRQSRNRYRPYFRDKRLYFYGAIVMLAFLLSAGDFMATGLLAVPLFALYEAGIFLTALFSRKRKKGKDDEAR